MEGWPTALRLLAVFAVCILLATSGCELVGTQNAQNKHGISRVASGQKQPLDERLLSMLSYYSWLQRRSSSELKIEYERLQRVATDDAVQRNHLRLALLLSLPENPFSDDGRARSLLQRYLNAEQKGDEDEAFALFLLKLLEERGRYKSQVATLESKVKDYHVVMNELQKERALRSKLEDQVQQLKNIEENLIEREQVTMPPATE